MQREERMLQKKNDRTGYEPGVLLKGVSNISGMRTGLLSPWKNST